MRMRPWAVGVFIVVGLVLFTGILFLIGNQHKAFDRHVTLYTEFSNLSGLTSGAKVRVSGFDSGEVKRVEVPKTPSGKFRVALELDDKVHKIIRTDSVASIETQGVVGDIFVAIKKGTDGAQEASAGTTLPSKEPQSMGELMDKSSSLLNDVHGTINDVRGRVDGALNSLTRTVNHVDGLVVGVRPNIQKIARNGGQITEKLDATITDINQGKGSIGLLLKDNATRQQLQSTLSGVNRTSANIEDASARMDQTVANFQSRDLVGKADATLENVKSMSAELSTMTQNALAPDAVGADGATNVRQTLSNLNRGTQNIAADGEALKHNFFLRGFFKKRGYYSLDQLTPEQYRRLSGHDKEIGSRQWLQASNFVSDGSDGKEQLSQDGRHQIDAAVSPVVDSLADSKIIVEGYADRGSPDQQFLRSRQRADLVRQYLETHFHVPHDSVGIVPLRSKPPESAAVSTWDGAAIVLLEQKSK